MIDATSAASASDTGSWIAGQRDKLQPVSDPLTNKSTFLQLLVAQIKNQNPLNPEDGMQFVAQLAQFSQLEQSVSMSEDIAGIRKDLETSQPSAAGASGAFGGGTKN